MGSQLLTGWGISLRKGIKSFCLCSGIAPGPLVLCQVLAAGDRALAGPTALIPTSSSCYTHAASPLPCEVVPSWLWEGGVLARREVAHEKFLYLITSQAVTEFKSNRAAYLAVLWISQLAFSSLVL